MIHDLFYKKRAGRRSLLSSQALTENRERTAIMAGSQLPSLDYLRQCVTYDPETGKIVWLRRPIEHFRDEFAAKRFNSLFPGKPAFNTMHRTGALVGSLDGRQILAHRIAFYIGTGTHPDKEVDHINGNPADNRIANLRLVSRSENARNRKRSPGIRQSYAYGVRQSSKNSWRAFIGVDGKLIPIGSYPTAEAAFAARREAEKQYGFSPIHGRPPVEPKRPFEQKT